MRSIFKFTLFEIGLLISAAACVDTQISPIAATATMAERNTTTSIPALEDPKVAGEISIQLPKTTYILHEPITATVTWQVTHGWVTMIYAAWFLDFKTSLVDGNTRPVPYSDMGLSYCENASDSCDSDAILYAGTSRMAGRLDTDHGPDKITPRITDWFNISSPGVYTLTIATRNIVDSSAMQAGLESRTRFVSQPITFTVALP